MSNQSRSHTNLTCKQRFWCMSIFARVVIVKIQTVVECLSVNIILLKAFIVWIPSRTKKKIFQFYRSIKMYHAIFGCPFFDNVTTVNGNDAFKIRCDSLFSLYFWQIEKCYYVFFSPFRIRGRDYRKYKAYEKSQPFSHATSLQIV